MAHNYPAARCLFCQAQFEFIEGQNDKVPGRVYSLAGKKEVGISGICETCFDKITAPPDEEEIDPEPPEIIWQDHADPTLYNDVNPN